MKYSYPHLSANLIEIVASNTHSQPPGCVAISKSIYESPLQQPLVPQVQLTFVEFVWFLL